MVRIRDDQLGPMPGVRIKDHGPKVSCSTRALCKGLDRHAAGVGVLGVVTHFSWMWEPGWACYVVW